MPISQIPPYTGSVPDISLDTPEDFSLNVEDINNYLTNILPPAINTASGEIDSANTSANNAATSAADSANIAQNSESAVLATTNATIYDSSITYSVNDVVIATNGKTYRCISASVGDEPSSTPSKWVNVASLSLEEVTDIPTKVNGGTLKAKDDGTGYEWQLLQGLELADLTNVPTKVNGKYLKVKDDGTGYEWSESYATSISEIGADLQLAYTDANSFYNIIENDLKPDMLTYKTTFRDWFMVDGNTGFIDPLQDQNVFDNIVRSKKALQFLATFDDGYDWMFSKISNSAYTQYIEDMLSAGLLDSIKNTATVSSLDFDNTSYSSVFEVVSDYKAFAYISKLSLSNTDNTTIAIASITTESGAVETSEESVTATSSDFLYSPSSLSGMLSLKEVKLSFKVDDAVGTADASAEVVYFTRPTSISIEHDTSGDSACAVGDWTCIVKEDLQKSLLDTTSFSYKLNNDTTGNELEYITALNTLLADIAFTSAVLASSVIVDNLFNVKSIWKSLLSEANAQTAWWDWMLSNYASLTSKIGTYIVDCENDGLIGTNDKVEYSAQETDGTEVRTTVSQSKLGWVSQYKAADDGGSTTEGYHRMYIDNNLTFEYTKVPRATALTFSASTTPSMIASSSIVEVSSACNVDYLGVETHFTQLI